MLVHVPIYVSDRVYELLEEAAADHNTTVSLHAADCVEAALRLFLMNTGTTAIPNRPPIIWGWGKRLNIPLSIETIGTIGRIAHVRHITTAEMLVGIVELAFLGYEQVRAEGRAIKPPEQIRPRGKPIFHNEPFDPKRYAKSLANGASLDAELQRRAMACERREHVRRGQP